jgi:hypothetical protein
MNTTIGSGRIKTPLEAYKQVLVALTVLLLGALAIAAAATLTGGDSGTPPPSSARSGPGDARPPIQHTIYVAGSQAAYNQALADATQLKQEQAANGVDDWSFQVLLAGSDSDTSIALAAIADTRARWEDQGMSDRVQVLDLRTLSAETGVRPVASASATADTASKPLVQLTIYLVGNEEAGVRATAAGVDAVNEQAANGAAYPWSFLVLVAGNESEEMAARQTIEETRARWAAQGMADRIEVIDQR